MWGYKDGECFEYKNKENRAHQIFSVDKEQNNQTVMVQEWKKSRIFVL